MNIDEFVASMQVQVNILDEQKREQAIYEQGVRAMLLASNQESQ
jgi:hypothetical protein